MRQGFQIYHDDIKALESLTDEQMGRLVRLVCHHSQGFKVEPDKDILIAFEFIKQKVDRDAKKYQERCEKNRANASNRKQSLAVVSNRKRNVPTVTVTETVTETVTNKALDYSQRKDPMEGVLMNL